MNHRLGMQRLTHYATSTFLFATFLFATFLFATFLFANEGCSTSCEEERPDLCSAFGRTILGPGARHFEERDEANNGSEAGAEDTGYTLESVDGLAIEGSFESTAPTRDGYRFDSGALGGIDAPGLPGIDVQVVIDGRVIGIGDGVVISLRPLGDVAQNERLGASFFEAELIQHQPYLLSIYANAGMEDLVAGASYRIELRGHAAP